MIIDTFCYYTTEENGIDVEHECRFAFYLDSVILFSQCHDNKNRVNARIDDSSYILDISYDKMLELLQNADKYFLKQN